MGHTQTAVSIQVLNTAKPSAVDYTSIPLADADQEPTQP